jgi:cytochrome c oxidase accessory protein FixG
VLLIISAYALFLFTAIAGRLWCGYACPQTVYTEMFMWVEQKIEGDRNARIRLDAAPWSADKLAKRSAKHAVWIAISLWTGITFVGYFTPIRELVRALPFDVGGWAAFWILFYGFATYGNAGWMREQVCKYMCPYARFQSAMFDPDTLIIAYDPQRGEPRGPRSRKVDHKSKGLGDCVDCQICVQVCPTGIDIRNGLQNECIGCAACIDGCNQVMQRMGYPKGLIRYDSENGLANGYDRAQLWRRVLRPRTMIYSAILVAIVATMAVTLASRNPLKVDVMRDRGALAREAAPGVIENTYRLQIMNTDESPRRFTIEADGVPGLTVVGVEMPVAVEAAGSKMVPLRLQAAAEAAPPGSHRIEFRVTAVEDARVRRDEKSTFILPRQ